MARDGKKEKAWFQGFGSIFIAILTALLLRWLVIEAYVIPSASMAPSLYTNDHIFVNKMAFGIRLPFTERWLWRWSQPSRGDVVVFKFPGDNKVHYIKRVVGLPGDRILFENGNLYVNDEFIERTVPTQIEVVRDLSWLRDDDFPGEGGQGGMSNYTHWQEQLGHWRYSTLLRKDRVAEETFGPYTVPRHHFFVLGDNRDNSDDSRTWSDQAVAASGEIEISRTSSSQNVIQIPLGSMLVVQGEDQWKQKYRTLEAAQLIGDSVKAKVQAINAGPSGDLPNGVVFAFEGDLAGEGLAVVNPQPISGGLDRRFVPQSHLVGRAWFVWLSCEKMLPSLSFLCHPLHLRWGRIFRSVHHRVQ